MIDIHAENDIHTVRFPHAVIVDGIECRGVYQTEGEARAAAKRQPRPGAARVRPSRCYADSAKIARVVCSLIDDRLGPVSAMLTDGRTVMRSGQVR